MVTWTWSHVSMRSKLTPSGVVVTAHCPSGSVVAMTTVSEPPVGLPANATIGPRLPITWAAPSARQRARTGRG